MSDLSIKQAYIRIYTSICIYIFYFEFSFIVGVIRCTMFVRHSVAYRTRDARMLTANPERIHMNTSTKAVCVCCLHTYIIHMEFLDKDSSFFSSSSYLSSEHLLFVVTRTTSGATNMIMFNQSREKRNK